MCLGQNLAGPAFRDMLNYGTMAPLCYGGNFTGRKGEDYEETRWVHGISLNFS